MKDPLSAAIDQYFNDGWKQFAKDCRQRNRVSNERMYRLLAAIKGPEFVEQVRQYKITVRAKDSRLRIARKPLGLPAPSKEFGTIWVHQGRNGLGKYTRIWIQVKPDRWIHFS